MVRQTKQVGWSRGACRRGSRPCPLRSAGATAGNNAANPSQLEQSGTLVVGMNLQFKPQMYLDTNGKPAGYDVDAAEGARQADGASSSKSRTSTSTASSRASSRRSSTWSPSGSPRRPSGGSRSASAGRTCRTPRSSPAATSDTTPATIAAWNNSDKTITSLQGSTAEQLVKKTFPNATSSSFPDQNAAFLEVATGRANGIVVENYLLAQFNKSNEQQAQGGRRSRSRCTSSTAPTASRRATPRSRRDLSTFICKIQKSGQLGQGLPGHDRRDRCRRCRPASSTGQAHRPAAARRRPLRRSGIEHR